MIPGPACTSVYLLLTLPYATVHLMLKVLSVRGCPSVNKPTRVFAALTLTVTCGGAHTGKQTMNQQHANNGARQMGSWKQMRSEINIASGIVLTGRLSGRRVAHCNRITDTLDKGRALSFSISSTFRSDPCTAAAAGLMYKGVGTKCTQSRVHTTRPQTPSGDTSVTPSDQKDLRSPAGISRKHLQEAQPSRLNSGLYFLPWCCAESSADCHLHEKLSTASSSNSRKKNNHFKPLNNLEWDFEFKLRTKKRAKSPESTLVLSTLMIPVLSATSWLFPELAGKRVR